MRSSTLKKAILLFLLLVVTMVYLQAQTISGTVRSKSDNRPLIGATVQIKGTANGTITDANGRYKLLQAKMGDSIIFSSIGFETQIIPVSYHNEINVQLSPLTASLNQLVVIGYGSVQKKDLTGAVSQIQASKFKNQAMTQVTDMLAGTIAGVNINQGTSASGSSKFMQVRGRTSLNAVASPMIVVDGSIFNGSLEDINPFDVATIDVLKDASAAAIYGARASNGVIIITTKRGAKGKPSINFSAEVGMGEPAHNYLPYNGEQYIAFRQNVMQEWGTKEPSYYYDNPNKLPTGVSLKQWRNLNANAQSNNTVEWLNRLQFFPTEIQNYLAGRTTNWYNLVMQHGLRQTYNISISGGSDRSSYYWSGGYVKNEGIIIGDRFSAVRSRFNGDYKVTSWLDIGMDAQLSANDTGSVPANLTLMFDNSPYGSMFDSTGKVNFYPSGYSGLINPLLNTFDQQNSAKSYDLFTTLFANLTLPFGFSYRISFQPHYNFGHDYAFWPSATTVIGSVNFSNGYGSRQDSSVYEWILDNVINWKRSFGPHKLDVTLLYSSEAHNTWNTLVTNSDFSPNQNLGYHALQFGTTPTIYNNDTRYTGDGLMGRLNYSLYDTYLLTLSIRRDGFSAFGQQNPYAIFPAAAFAWVASNEKFFHVSWVNNLKLRASWGVNGNRDIGIYSALAQISPDQYFDGTNVLGGVSNTTLPNPDLKWERTTAFNYGLNASILNNRMTMDANYYRMRTTNLLMLRILPAITGFSSIMANLGEVDNQGFETTITSINVQRKNLIWESSLVFSLNRNKIKHLFGNYEEVTRNGKTFKVEVPDYTNEWFPGQAIDRVWDYKITGIWQENEKAAAAVYNLLPGDIKAVDVDKDGSYQEINDKQFIGYLQPRYRLGLRNDFTLFNNLTVSLFIRADLGQIAKYDVGYGGVGADHSEYDRTSTQPAPDYWTPQNPVNNYPRLMTAIVTYGGGLNMYEPNSFVRIQDFTVGYTIPDRILRKSHVTDLRIFGSIENLYAFTKWPGWDPEAAESGIDGPMPRIFTFGLNFSL